LHPAISEAVLSGIRAHAEDAVPFECCGLITVEGKVIRCENAARDRTTQFQIAQHQIRRAMRQHEIVGVYHSHVNQAAYISQADKDGMGWFVGKLYVVASVVNGVCRDVKVFIAKNPS
jgi:proteasome lid subunit RPN8/RPN11